MKTANWKIRDFVRVMRDRELKLAMAESITCGMAAERLCTVIGTSDVLRASVVCYRPEAKVSILGVPRSLIEKYTPESKEVTAALTRGLEKLVQADVYAAVTGLASPGGSETVRKPVGTVFVCVIYGKRVRHMRKQFKGTPAEIRSKACMLLYMTVIKAIS